MTNSGVIYLAGRTEAPIRSANDHLIKRQTARSGHIARVGDQINTGSTGSKQYPYVRALPVF